jgi:hypothetical protein
VRRVHRALQQTDPGGVLALTDARVAAEADPARHTLHRPVGWQLERQLTPLGGGHEVPAVRAAYTLRPALCFQPAPHGDAGAGFTGDRMALAWAHMLARPIHLLQFMPFRSSSKFSIWVLSLFHSFTLCSR